MGDKAKRNPVDYAYDAINPQFLRWMAKIAARADEVYDSWANYKKSRLEGKNGPINHIYEHLRAFRENEPYDHFDKDVRWHLVGIAYNAMMEFYYVTRYGYVSPWVDPPKRPHIHAGFKDPMDTMDEPLLPKVECKHWGGGSRHERWDAGEAVRLWCWKCGGIVAKFKDGWFVVERSMQ